MFKKSQSLLSNNLNNYQFKCNFFLQKWGTTASMNINFKQNLDGFTSTLYTFLWGAYLQAIKISTMISGVKKNYNHCYRVDLIFIECVNNKKKTISLK